MQSFPRTFPDIFKPAPLSNHLLPQELGQKPTTRKIVFALFGLSEFCTLFPVLCAACVICDPDHGIAPDGKLGGQIIVDLNAALLVPRT